MMNLHEEMLAMGSRAVKSARALAQLGSDHKNRILKGMAEELAARAGVIDEANALDLADGKKAGLSAAMLDRLELTQKRIDAMCDGIRNVAALPDPVGHLLDERTRPSGLTIRKVRTPIGVIAIIYESRPNVTADAASLCIKSSNAVILRGGKESIRSNQTIADALQAGGEKEGLPPNAIQLVGTTDRDAVRELVQMEGKVDVVIPRGGESLIRSVAEMARVPVIKHYKGVCHTFVDESADEAAALAICENAKCQRPGVCNAMETLLVHEAVAQSFLPRVADLLISKGVELRGDARSREIVPGMKEATEADWYEEYLDLILAVRVVPDVHAAIDHINTYGSHHSDAIVSRSQENGRIFVRDVDSATVYVNASTRFTDGAEFGLGAEIGISTDKLHPRGPMGLEELTTYKYILTGDGLVRK